MVLILIVLLFTSMYFSACFFLLSKNIREATKDFKKIYENIEQNNRLTLDSPNKDMENLLKEINEYLSKMQMEKIKYMKREKEIRKEIENISHDLRTPLTSILGYLELMKNDENTDDENNKYISIVERKSKGLENLIQTFYDLSILEAKEYKMEIESIDINKELMEQLLIFYNDFEKKGIDVNVNLSEEAINIEGDTKSIDRVFANLIQNAIKYSISSFNVSLEKDNKNVNIVFSNDIYNLSEEDVENLFNRFYMKDDSRNNQGSGLGLTITKLLIEEMGGSITAEINNNWIYFKISFKTIRE